VPSTVAEVVAAGRLSRRRPLVPMRRDDRVAIHGALDAVGLADRAHHQVSTLSGGQQQRVLMARTLAGQPELLVLDEPNAGVDLESQEAIADTLATLTGAGATIVVVLHELGPFADLIQRTLMLREGRLVYDGPPLDHGHPEHHHHHRPTTPPLLRPSVQAPLDGGLT
jgi:zinc transport system ATP-binding protein